MMRDAARESEKFPTWLGKKTLGTEKDLAEAVEMSAVAWFNVEVRVRKAV